MSLVSKQHVVLPRICVICSCFLWLVYFILLFFIFPYLELDSDTDSDENRCTPKYLPFTFYFLYFLAFNALFSFSFFFMCRATLHAHCCVGRAACIWIVYDIIIFFFILIIRFVFAETHRSDEIKSVKMWLHGTQIWYVRLLQTDLTINWFEHNTRIDWTIQKI